jgi:hypothetical protein
MTKVTVFARDNDKPGNREVVAFIRQYMPQFVRAGIRFTFTVADPIERQLVQRGIDKLPAISVERVPGKAVNHLTPVEIKSALLKFIGGGKSAGRAGPRKPEDEMQDYYAREMNMDKWEEDQEEGDDGLNKKDIMSRVQEEMERRQTEHDRRGPPKSRPRRRPGNVRQQNGRFADDEDDRPARRPARRRQQDDDEEYEPEPHRAAAPDRRPQTPHDRLRQAGGDPNNRDDAMLASMMECSDDI